jgi:hypothetical protein
VVFVASDLTADSAAYAEKVDAVLKNQLTSNVCVDQESGLSDRYRNAFYADEKFRGLLKDKLLFTEKKRPPAIPDSMIDEVKPTELPAKNYNVKRVTLPSDDYPYPLWPELPKPRPYPDYPKVPEKQKLSSTVEIRIPDPKGPGCGWAFLETVSPSYDKKKIDGRNTSLINYAQKVLDADGPRWQKDVLQYWEDYAKYQRQVKRYGPYRREVKLVAEAWDEIHEQWKDYYTDHANWEIYMEDREDLIAAKKSARQSYQSALARCSALREKMPRTRESITNTQDAIGPMEIRLRELQDKREEAEDDGDPLTVEGDDLSPSEEQELESLLSELRDLNDSLEELEDELQGLEEDYDNYCPAKEPAILDDEVPEKRPEPKKPADPRPLAEQTSADDSEEE